MKNKLIINKQILVEIDNISDEKPLMKLPSTIFITAIKSSKREEQKDIINKVINNEFISKSDLYESKNYKKYNKLTTEGEYIINNLNLIFKLYEFKNIKKKLQQKIKNKENKTKINSNKLYYINTLYNLENIIYYI